MNPCLDDFLSAEQSNLLNIQFFPRTCFASLQTRNPLVFILSVCLPSRRPAPAAKMSHCAKDKKARLPRGATNTATAGGGSGRSGSSVGSDTLPLSDIVVEKQLLAKLAVHNTSCAGCIASVRGLLARPLRYSRVDKSTTLHVKKNDHLCRTRVFEMCLWSLYKATACVLLLCFFMCVLTCL